MPFGAAIGGLDLGIGSAIGAGLADVGLGFIPTGLVTGGLEGAGLSAATDLITGKPLTAESILPGAVTGGVLGSGVGGAISEATGIPTLATDVALGAGTNAATTAVLGGNAASGAIAGAGGGLLAGVGGGGSTATPSTTTGGAVGGGPAIAAGAPAAIGSATPDLTSIGGSGLNEPASGLSGATASAPISGTDTVSNAFGGSSNISGDAATAAGGVGGAGKGILDFVKNNPMILGAGLLGANFLRGNSPLPAQKQLQSEIGTTNQAAASLMSYETTGKLPPGLQSAVDATTKANEASIRSQFARMGMAGSTSETQALEGARTASTAQVAKIAQDLFNQGISLSQLSASELSDLLKIEQQQNTDFSNSLASFAAGLAGARTSKA